MSSMIAILLMSDIERGMMFTRDPNYISSVQH